MGIDEMSEGKLSVLLSQLRERYYATHKMRDRSLQFALWILGFGLGMVWLLLSTSPLSWIQVAILGAFIVTVGTVSFCFVYAIKSGFEKTFTIVRRCENALGLYDDDVYCDGECILPSEYEAKKRSWKCHFKTLQVLMLAVFVFLLLLTVTQPLIKRADKDTSSITSSRVDN